MLQWREINMDSYNRVRDAYMFLTKDKNMPKYEVKYYISVGRFGELTEYVNPEHIEYISGDDIEELKKSIIDELNRLFRKDTCGK